MTQHRLVRRTTGLIGSGLLAIGLVAGAVPGATASAPAGPAQTAPASDAMSPANMELTREDMLTRAYTWIEEQVPYSQSSSWTNEYGTYRQDCSGYVSLAWGLSQSHWTGNLMEVAHNISHDELEPGDALFRHDSSSQHVAIFVRWADSAQTQAVVWEQYNWGEVAEERTWSASRTSSFQPIRYDNVLPDGAITCHSVGQNFAAYEELTQGDSGDQVSAAQCLLGRAGFAIGDDPHHGEFDEATTDAVRAFQQDIGLEESGSVDAATWTALLSQGSTPTLQNGSSGEPVQRLQRALTAALGSTVEIDGQFGPNTRAAVEEYQQTRDLDVDGIAGPQTWSALQAGK